MQYAMDVYHGPHIEQSAPVERKQKAGFVTVTIHARSLEEADRRLAMIMLLWLFNCTS